MVDRGERAVYDGGELGDRFTFLKAWRSIDKSEIEKPLRPEERSGVCGVDEEDGLSMETEAEDEEKEKSYKGIDADRLEKEGDKREIRRLIDPRKPTTEEVDEHELTHVPYRNWCPICVMAKGKELDHRKSIEEPRGLSEYSFY